MPVERAEPATVGGMLLPELARLPGHLIWRAHARVLVALDQILPVGMDIHGYAALLALAGNVTRSQQALARTICVSRTTMVKVAGDLSAQGLVDRVRSPEDRRSYALTRNAEGSAAARRWRRYAEELEGSLSAGFTGEDRAELCRLLLVVVEEELAADTPEDLRTSLGFLVTRTHARMHRDFLGALEPLGIEPRHFGALTALSSVGPVPQAELARYLGVSGATVVAMVDDLEHAELLERRRLESDRRTQVLHPLPRTTSVLARARTIAEATMARQLAPLTDAEAERLVALLVRFVTAP